MIYSCNGTKSCKCGATGCPNVCLDYYVSDEIKQKITITNKKSYNKFIDSRITKRKRK